MNERVVKWSPTKQPRLNKTFATAYPDHEFHVVSRDNYMDYLL